MLLPPHIMVVKITIDTHEAYHIEKTWIAHEIVHHQSLSPVNIRNSDLTSEASKYPDCDMISGVATRIVHLYQDLYLKSRQSISSVKINNQIATNAYMTVSDYRFL